MRIFIDFDYTLCNTLVLKKDIKEVFRAHGVDAIDLPESRDTYNRIGHYTVRKHLELSHCPQELIPVIENDFFSRATQWLYPDSAEFFARNANHDISILSYGDVDFQQRKIESSGLSVRAAAVICTADSKVEALKKHVAHDEAFMIIDDRAHHLNAVCEAFPQAKAVRILRKESPYLSEISTCAVTLVDDLLFAVDQVK